MCNLKKVMDDKEVKVSTMALDTGYHRQTIYQWRRGICSPNIYTARDIAGYLGVTDRDIWQ